MPSTPLCGYTSPQYSSEEVDAGGRAAAPPAQRGVVVQDIPAESAKKTEAYYRHHMNMHS